MRGQCAVTVAMYANTGCLHSNCWCDEQGQMAKHVWKSAGKLPEPASLPLHVFSKLPQATNTNPAGSTFALLLTMTASLPKHQTFAVLYGPQCFNDCDPEPIGVRLLRGWCFPYPRNWRHC
jgi:hypothetical protein